MAELDILEFLDLGRAKSIQSDSEKLSDSEAVILNEVKEKDFGVDLIYFNTDEETNNSFPAVFLKKVTNFNDVETLKDIAETQRKIWNYKKVLFLYVYSETEIRIYNCSEKPLIVTKDDFDYKKELKGIEINSYQYSDKQQLQELNKLFSRIAIDTGIIWTLEDAQFIRDKINLQKRVDKYLVESLINTSNQLENEGLEINFIHKIILRSLFLLYLEDRGATDKKLYSVYKKEASSYFDILDDAEATYKLYERLEDDFNGNVFTLERNPKGEIIEKISTDQLQIIKKCFISGNDNTPQTKLFEEWRLFNFSIIQIELLSEIYENFLFKTDPELKKQTGTYYTPPSLVEFILNEKLPTNNGEKNCNVKVLDPSCGSGIFLVESFKRLVKRYENQTKEKLNDFEKLKKLLTDNIFGIELHPQAIKVAAFSLYLALVDCLDPKTLWQKKKHRLPNLINNPNDSSLKTQGKNLFCRDTIAQNKEIEAIEFDLVVGNPPFGTTQLSKSIRNYCNSQGFATEMVLPFLHKATLFAPKGEIALIFNTKILTNTKGTYQNFRKWLFNDCYVDKVFNFSILRNAKKNFGGQLFGDATGPISIVFYQKEQPKKSNNKIAYYAPKTFIKSNVIEGLSIDFTDLKFLPREECQKPNSKIWKIAMWGGMNDWNFLEELNSSNISIEMYLKKEDIDYGVGFQVSSPRDKANSEIKQLPIHSPNNILKYYTPVPNKRIDFDHFHRLGKLEAYQSSHILLNEGVKVNEHQLSLLASFVDYKSAYSKGIVGIYSKNNDELLLKLLTAYLNSDFIRYYAFLTTSSWGIERDVVKHKELFEAPYLLEQLSDNQKNNIIKIFDEKLYEKTFYTVNKSIENEINEIILSCLSENEQYIVQHLLNNIELFHKQEKSVSLHPIKEEQVSNYSKIISQEINDFLDGQELYANITVYNIGRFSPLMMIKLTFDKKQKEINPSKEFIDEELKKLDQHLWEKKSSSVYFKKKLNYKTGDDIYIIRPNQRRFWSQSMALEDASELILEILNGN
ncbi:HsdM family class I SAM-dependent methyltransferase [Chryseobacterium taihuense]|uniref:site-specific DNA-methyltransferase (adenine-specific) n=1 Tax=Chryseobacterium taihuense TaxID=1141221 RepID=A0ABY0QPH4_9FLAO|nr:N-6 DNA methylase [Chryseobacterium taihuense]SDL44105.1 Type I restriction-modification system, DNA methylase subunit [Chryseobacterium taihuense]